MLHIYVFPKEDRSLLEEPTKIYGISTKTTKKTLLEDFSRIITVSPKTLKNCRNSGKMTNVSNKRKRETSHPFKKPNTCDSTFLYDQKLNSVDAFVYDLHTMFKLRDLTSRLDVKI